MAERSQIDEVKDRLDIVSVAQTYLRSNFKKSGRNTFTLCPFHNENSPSFSLNSELGIYKCFGCGESGDVISFIEKMEGVEFPEALEIAANRAGVKLKDELSPKDKKKLEEKKRAIKAHTLAAEFFHYLLTEHKSGKDALKYCENRKLRMQELKKFKIGFAPNGFENLKKYMLKKGFNEDELIKFGLQVSKKNRVYDKFRNRLMFPIFNHRGDIVAFSGRTLEKDGIPKYLNSPETIIYKKSDIVYGLYQAKESIRKNNFAIIAEGNVEPLSSTKVGIENVVVPMGTGLTKEQLKLIKRYCDEIYFAFDTDEAGQRALLRSIKLANQVGFFIKAINLGKYKDPDDMIQEAPEKWTVAVADAVDIIEYLINTFKKQHDLTTAKGKSDYIKEILPYIRTIADDVQTEHYLKELAEITNTNQRTVISNYNKGSERIDSDSEEQSKISEINLSKEEYLTAIAIAFPDKLQEIKKNLNSKKLKSILEKVEKNKFKNIRDKISKNDQKIFDKLATFNLSQITDGNVDEEIRKITKNLEISRKTNKIQRIRDQIKELEKTGGDVTDLLKELQSLLKK